jgi:hypothetical protein
VGTWPEWQQSGFGSGAPEEAQMSKRKRYAPGERMREIGDALLEATRRHGRAVRVPEVREVYYELGGTLDPSTIPTVLCTLERSGIAVRVGGRHRGTQWRHSCLEVPADREDIALAIVDAVQALSDMHMRPVTSGEVQAALAAIGIQLTVDQTRTKLESLAHTSERKQRRSAAEWSAAKVARISETTSAGKPRVLWAPLGSRREAAPFANSRDALRYAISAAEHAAGRPLSKRELTLWLEYALKAGAGANAQQAAEILLRPTRVRRGIQNTLVIDARLAKAQVKVHAIRTPLTCRGTYPQRYAAGAPDDVAALTCLVEDVAMLLRPADEIASIERLRQTAEEDGSDLLLHVADFRSRCLAESAAGLLEPHPDVLVAQAVELSITSHRVISHWDRFAHGRLARYHRESDVVTAQAAAFMDLLPLHATRESGSVLTIDRTSGVPVATFTDLVNEALALNNRTLMNPAVILKRARRVRGPTAGGLSARVDTQTRSFLDRPDAIMTLVQACYLPRMAALVDSAITVLGGVVRDASVLKTWSNHAEIGDNFTRSAIAIAAALMGECPECDAVWPDKHDAEQASAYFAAIAIAVDDLEDRIALAADADALACASACMVSDRALARIEAGARLSVVEQ